MGRYRVRDLLLPPSLLSFSRIPLAAAFVVVLSEHPILALSALLLAGITDVLDGYWARRYGQATPTGAVVDGVLDKLFVTVVVAALVLRGQLPVSGAVLLATRELGELPLIVWWAAHDGKRRARAEDPRANWLGKVATVFQFLAIAALLIRGQTPWVWLGLSGGIGVASAIAYWRRELATLGVPSVSSADCDGGAPTQKARGLHHGLSSNGDANSNSWDRSSVVGPRTKGIVMGTFNRGYRLKAAGLLLVIGAIAAALFLGPALRKSPELGAPIDMPSMSNIPPEGSLHIETE
jgi:cardiolipin synthase (CMP-forming)